MQVIVNLHSAHMDPDDWQQPQQFALNASSMSRAASSDERSRHTFLTRYRMSTDADEYLRCGYDYDSTAVRLLISDH